MTYYRLWAATISSQFLKDILRKTLLRCAIKQAAICVSRRLRYKSCCRYFIGFNFGALRPDNICGNNGARRGRLRGPFYEYDEAPAGRTTS